jgi:DNA-binding SARP family transcriptional activator
VRVAILGPLEVHEDVGAPVAVAGARLRSLIARLALAGGQPVSTGALAEAVWDCAPPADVANALQTLVSRMPGTSPTAAHSDKELAEPGFKGPGRSRCGC